MRREQLTRLIKAAGNENMQNEQPVADHQSAHIKCFNTLELLLYLKAFLLTIQRTMR